MSVFLDILNLLTSSPGAMVYYLALLLSVWAIVGLALSRWSRGERHALVPRLLAAGALISFSRFVPIVIALLDRQNGAYLVPIGPPLERFVDTLSALLICWAFVVPSRKRTFGRAFLGSTALFTIGLYVITATEWASAFQANSALSYNLYWQRWVWEPWQLFFLLGALVYLLVIPVQEGGLLIVGLGTLAVGHLLQAVVPMAEQIPDFAAWVRFANLLAFPMLAIVAYRLVIRHFEVQTTDLETTSQETLSQITGLMAMLDTHQKMSSSLELDAVLENIVQGVSEVLRSSLCAVALFPGGSKGSAGSNEMELAALYNDPRVTWERRRFLPAEYPAIQYAVTRHKAVLLDPATFKGAGNGDQVSQVYHLLDGGQNGPLIVQPLELESAVIGVILACRPDQPIPFTPVDARKSETLAAQIVATLKSARLYQQSTERISRLQADLQQLETDHVRTKADLDNRLKKKQQELTLYIQKLYETEMEQQRAQKDAAEAHKQLLRLKEESQAEIARRRAELQQNTAQVDRLTQRIAQLDAVRLRLEERVQALERENEELQFQLAVAATAQPGFALTGQGLHETQTASPRSQEAGPASAQQKAQWADERTRARDQFLASLAQELRTPMTSILGYTELLMNESVGKLEGIQRKFLQRVQANIERMRGMLNDLIGITMIDAGNLTIELEPVDVVSVIETALHKVQFRLEEKELGTQLELADLPVILADPECVQQIVDNLLTNACKSSISGTSIVIHANVETNGAEESQLHFAVSDTGGGIAAEDRERVFERFYRADSALISGLGETGVGLSIVKSLVEAHRGQVWTESEMGIGTTFHFTLPYGLDQMSGNGSGKTTLLREYRTKAG
jgi:signal transduction histidine kinase